MKSRLLALAAICAAALTATAPAGVAQTARDETGVIPLPGDLMAAASAFERYTRGAAAIDGGFASGASVAKAVAATASYEPKQFETGMIAYAALAAMQDERFVAGVRAMAGERSGYGGYDSYGGGFAQRLLTQPYAVLQVDGADGAAAAAAQALAARGAPLSQAGRTVKQSAYDVQHSAWSKAMVPAPAERLAKVKALSAQRFAPDEADIGRLLQASTGARLQRASWNSNSQPTPVVIRALALAAEAILGEADDSSRLTGLLADPAQTSCLRMAKLNLYQCFAVAGPHYEDIFCVGQHAMIDTGACVSKAAGVGVAPPLGQGVAQSGASH